MCRLRLVLRLWSGKFDFLAVIIWLRYVSPSGKWNSDVPEIRGHSRFTKVCPPNSGKQHRPYLKQVLSNSSSGLTARKRRVVNETMTSVYTNRIELAIHTADTCRDNIKEAHYRQLNRSKLPAKYVLFCKRRMRQFNFAVQRTINSRCITNITLVVMIYLLLNFATIQHKMVKTGQFTTKCKGNRVIALKRQISFC